MSLKTIIVDFDNTIADTASRIIDYFPNYEPKNQETYIFSGEFSDAINLYGNGEFYDQNLLLLNFQVVQYIVEECKKEPTRIIFISSCMNEETRKSKVDFLERFGDSYFSEAIELNYEMIKVGKIESRDVYEFFNLYDSDKEVIAIDDFEERLRGYVELGSDELKIVAIEHPYSREFVMSMKTYMSEILFPNYILWLKTISIGDDK